LDTYDTSNNVFANNIIYGDGNGSLLPVPNVMATIPLLYPDSGCQRDASGNIIMIVNGGSNPLIIGDINGFNLINNIFVGTLGQSTTGFINIDPKLQMNSAGYYSIVAGSPATGYSNNPNAPLLVIPGITTDPSMVYDITGQLRNSSPIDIGCNQIITLSSGLEINKPLSVTDVGVMYSTYSP